MFILVSMILGIDEVGRGPWAGPLVVGAVVLSGAKIEGITDSKKLTKKQRQILASKINHNAAAVALGWVSASELDDLGMAEALKLATRRAVEQIVVPYSEIIIDGTVNFLAGTGKGPYVTTMKKGDLLVPSISAASIVAKVARDQFMTDQDKLYPGYGFASHAGYGTALHRQAIEQLGISPLHRLSFAPLQKYRSLQLDKSQYKNIDRSISTRTIGDASETAACDELVRRGHEIIERNWKTKLCEIDIVSRQNDTTYFVEVKHRRNDRSGGGLEAITPKKLRQMKFAAELYRHTYHLQTDVMLLAVATASEPPVVTNVLKIY